MDCPNSVQTERYSDSSDNKRSPSKLRAMEIAILTLLVLLLGTPQRSLIAGIDVWTTSGPEGGMIYALATDPTNPNIVYAGSYGGSLFKSTNGGATWTTLNSGLSYSGISCPVHELLVDLSNPATVYLGSYGAGVFKSTDGGLSWTATTPLDLNQYIVGLAIDPSSPNKVFAATLFSILKSLDGGLTWTPKTSGLPSDIFYISGLGLDPHSPNNLYVSTEHGVYKSTDAGETWALANQGITNLNVTALAVDPYTSGVVYAATWVLGESNIGYLFKSTDGGANWVSAGLSPSFVNSITISQEGVFVASNGGVYRSTTGSSDWSLINSGLNFAVATDSAGSIYVGTQSRGVMKSTNQGVSWNFMNINLSGHVIQAIDTDNSGTPYVVTRTKGLYKGSGDGSWSALSNSPQFNVVAVAVDPGFPSILYAATNNGVYRSSNAGSSWNPSNNGLSTKDVSCLAIDPINPNVLYVGTSPGLFKSINGATSWNPANTGLPDKSYIRGLAVDPTNNNVIYASTQAFVVYKSSNGGGTWNALPSSPHYVVNTIVIDPTSPNTLYVGGHGGMVKSVDSGASWNEIEEGLTDDNMTSLMIDPMVPSTLYLGTYGGVFKSINGGATWTAMNAGLANLQVNGLALDPMNPGTIYAATQSGVFVFSSSAGTHAQVALSLPGGGAVSSITGGSGSLQHAGYAALTVNSGTDPYGTAVFSFVQNGTVVSEVGVPASPPTRNARFFIDYRSNVSGKSEAESAATTSINTGFAAVNQTALTATLTLTLRDPNGGTLQAGSLTVEPHAHIAKFIDQLGSSLILPAGFTTGSLEIASTQPISILALRLTTNQRNETLLTTTPIADLTQAPPSGSLFFPQMADGGGYRTTLMLLNTTTSTESGTMKFYDNNGLPMTVRLTTGPSDSTIPYTIPPGGVYVGVTDGSGPIVNSGSVQTIPDNGSSTPIGSGLFSLTQNGILVTESGVPSAAPTTHARIYVDLTGGHNTGLAMASPGNTAVPVTLTAFQTDGVTFIGSHVIPLSSNGHTAAFAGEFISALPSNFTTGVLDISAPSAFVALTLRSLSNSRGDFLMTTFPIADMTKPAPAPIVFPQIADGGGYQTQFILLNSSGASSSTTLSFYGDNGTPLPVGR